MGFGSVTAVDSAVAGVVKHFELSSDSPGDLDFLQAGAFGERVQLHGVGAGGFGT